MYDYNDETKNFQNYGLNKPPLYDISKIPNTIPYVLYSGAQDTLATPPDVAWLLEQIPNVIYHQQLEKYAHVDFSWGFNAAVDIYFPTLLPFLFNYTKFM